MSLPELPEQQPLRRVRALRQRHVERHGPAEAEPRRPLRVLRAAEEERSQVRLELLLQRQQLLGEHQQPHSDHRLRRAAGSALPSNESPTGSLWKSDWNNFAPRVGFAWDVNGDGKTSLRGGYGMAYERNFGNVTYNVLFNPPQYLVASIDAPTDVPSLPIYTDNAGPVRRGRRRHEDDPGGQPAPRGPEHRDRLQATSTASRCSASCSRTRSRARSSTPAPPGATLYDLADVNKRGRARSSTRASAPPATRPLTQYAAFNTRGNRGQSQYHGVTLGLESRKLGNTGLQFTAKYTLSHAKDNLSSTFSDSGSNDFNLGYLDAFDPMLDYGDAGVRRPAPADLRRASGSCRSSATPRASPGRSSAAGSSTGSSPPAPAYPFTRVRHARTRSSRSQHARRGSERHRQERDQRPGHRQPERVHAARPHAAAWRHGGRLREPDHRQLGVRPVPGRHDRSATLSADPAPGSST